METKKSPFKSVGIMGPLVALVVYAVNQFFPGLGLTEVETSTIVDQVSLVAGAVVGIYGRYRANTAIK